MNRCSEMTQLHHGNTRRLAKQPHVHVCSAVSDFSGTLWTVLHQAPLSIEFFQARIQESVAISSSRRSSWLRDPTCISCGSWIGRQNLYHWATWEAQGVSHSVMSNSYSLPGSSVHGISQAIILEWVAISFSRGSSQARDQTWVSCIVGRFFTIWATRKASSLTD